MKQFKIGDKVIYPGQGVAEVVGSEQREISGFSVAVFVLQVGTTKIMVPANNVDQVGLRPISNHDDIAKVYDALATGEVVPDNQTWNRRHRDYMDKMKTGDIFQIAGIVRELSVLGMSKELSYGERRLLDMARDLMVSEIAVSKSIAEDTVRAEIDGIFAAEAA